MAKNARSIKLDKAIEAELKIMLTLGVEKAPISPTTLLARLKAKEITSGGLSTLTAKNRKDMIAEYRYQQMSNSDINASEVKHKYGTVEYYKARNQTLIAEVSELNSKLSKNTAALVAIIKMVESTTPLKVESLIKGQDEDLMDDIPY
jgi:hypothetical protein